MIAIAMRGSTTEVLQCLKNVDIPIHIYGHTTPIEEWIDQIRQGYVMITDPEMAAEMPIWTTAPIICIGLCNPIPIGVCCVTNAFNAVLIAKAMLRLKND